MMFRNSFLSGDWIKMRCEENSGFNGFNSGSKLMKRPSTTYYKHKSYFKNMGYLWEGNGFCDIFIRGVLFKELED